MTKSRCATVSWIVGFQLCYCALAAGNDDTGTNETHPKTHWAFQPVRQPTVPRSHLAAARTPIDAFVLRQLQQAGLSLSPRADRRTLIRRLSYSVTGLPPTPHAVDRFINDPAPDAYDRLVDRMLKSPQHAEHWTRLWLDVARYSDTKGYVYGREERFWSHAWAYRDWVVNALNRDLPYNRFLLLQLAADQIVKQPASLNLAAMGFVTVGRRFQGIERDILDDRIDVVTRGTMALTVSCARCHDHMYDPIPTADYYALYGVFASSQEELVPIGDPEIGGADFQQELRKRRQAVRTRLATLRDEASQRSRERVADYLFAQTELEKYPASCFDQIFSKTDLLPGFVHRWADFLRKAKERNDPIFLPWHAYASLSTTGFAEAAAQLTVDNQAVHPLVAAEFRSPPASMRDVADRYGRVLADVDRPDAAALRRLLFGPDAVAEVPDLPIVHSQSYFDTDSITELYRLEGEVYRWLIRSNVEAPHALILRDRPTAVTPRIFIRGNPLRRGDEVPRRFLKVLSPKTHPVFERGSGRLELANAIVAPENPLTARVLVNRVWAHHFGRGLVDTPSDFGIRASPPSHPELLDWLAARFVSEGWHLGNLHRWILLSDTFQQSSHGHLDPKIQKRAIANDPDNRLLWRMNLRRLSWEQFRDSMLVAAEELDLKMGGKPVNLFQAPYPQRRTLYGLVDRQFLPSLLRTFDFASPDLHTPKRTETTVPQQALFFMNDPMVIDRARAIARSIRLGGGTRDAQLSTLFRRVWQREPTDRERNEARQLLSAASGGAVSRPRSTVAAWQYGYGAYDAQSQRVSGFSPLPHFTGSSWRGGEAYPDARLGWVQLTAEGGHPGNTPSHASVRRWTAPRPMRLSIVSRLVHEPAQGDGIRALIISSRAGLLAQANLHQDAIDLNVGARQVATGETIDFVVDIRKTLNYDQYLWSATLQDQTNTSADQAAPATWNSRTDFTPSQRAYLDAWEQLAQALLCSNEFIFID